MEMDMPDDAPSNKLLAPQESPLVRRIEPTIATTARPSEDWLPQIRADLNREEGLRTFFSEGRAQNNPQWAIDNVTIREAARWPQAAPDDIRECVQYLWDEYSQIGEGIHLTSPHTGKILATLTEDDLWQPDPVPRIDGTMVTPMPRIRPDLEGALISHFSNQAHENRVLARMSERTGETELLREEGDPRLLAVTKEGRRQLVDNLRHLDVTALLRRAGGTSRAFLQHFDLVRGPSEGYPDLTKIDGCAFTSTKRVVQDQMTLNLQHDVGGSLRVAAVQGWVREMARILAVRAHERAEPLTVPAAKVTPENLGGAPTWVCSPSTMGILAKTGTGARLLPVEGVDPVGLVGKVGVIVVPAECEVVSVERFERWEAQTALQFSLWVNWDAIRILGITGVPHQAVVF